MSEYRLITTQQAKFDELLNTAAKDGWYVDKMLQQGNHYSLLLHRYTHDEDDDIEESAEEQLWQKLEGVLGRLSVLEGALALKVQKDETDLPETAINNNVTY